jgi:putative transcriptional regulator
MHRMSLQGKLLIASPGLVDPNFFRTVVLVAVDADEGAMGLVLNRPAETTVAEAAPPLADIVEAGELVFAGGPVEPQQAMVLGEFDDPEEAATVVFADVGFLSLDEDAGPAGTPRRARVFAGHAGWGEGQLASELAEESWIVEPALPEDVFSDDPDGLWSTVLRRKGGHFALLATMPPDPSVN